MASPKKRRQKKLLLREQEREEVLEALPIEEEASESVKTTISKKVGEIFTAFADDSDENDPND